ncbi:DUF4158 domain-containing protein [Paenibacillus sp. GYB004]
MVRVRELLTPEERLQYLQIPPDHGEWELGNYFIFIQHDLEIIQQRRRDYNRLGFAMQLCVLHYLSWTLSDVKEVLVQVLRYIGKQINIGSRYEPHSFRRFNDPCIGSPPEAPVRSTCGHRPAAEETVARSRFSSGSASSIDAQAPASCRGNCGPLPVLRRKGWFNRRVGTGPAAEETSAASWSSFRSAGSISAWHRARCRVNCGPLSVLL